MLKFLFGRKADTKAEPTQREVITSLIADLNAALVDLPEKPVISIDPNSGQIDLELPDQMPDEALALPSPEMADTESEAKAA